VRTLISVPAGMELMPFTPFLLWTSGGSLIWVLILTLSGFALGKGYDNVELWLEPVAKTVKYLLMIAAIAFIAWLGLRVWRRR
jgi:alkaline phosphatase